MTQLIPTMGYVHDKEDLPFLHRRSLLLSQLPKAFSAPRSVSHRAWRKVEDQAQMSSCVGHGLSSGCEVLHYIDTSGQSIVELSRMYAYRTSQICSGITGDNGATISGAAKAARDYGLCLEKTMPYPSRYVTSIPPQAEEEGKKHPVLEHSVMQSADECYNWIGSGLGFILIGVPVHESLMNCDGELTRLAGRIVGAHCMVLHGYFEDGDFDLENSWGVRWGNNGFAKVRRSIVDQWCRDPQSEVIAFSDIKEYVEVVTRFNWLNSNWMV